MKNKSGMTLIEVMIALVITFIVFLGLSSAGLVVFNENIKNDLRDEATSVAGMEMELARNTPFDNLVALSDNVVRQVRGLTVTYRVSRTVATLDSDNLQVSINVAWTHRESNQTLAYNKDFATIVRR